MLFLGAATAMFMVNSGVAQMFRSFNLYRFPLCQKKKKKKKSWILSQSHNQPRWTRCIHVASK